MTRNRLRRRALVVIAVLLCLPGLVMGSWLTAVATFFDPLETDAEKYASANPALMNTVEWLRQRQLESDDPLVVYTSGEQRLNFFFPDNRTIIRDELPTTFDDLHPETDYLLGGYLADFLWAEQGTYPNQLSTYMGLGFVYTRPFLEYGHNIPDVPRPEWTSPLTPVWYENDAQVQLIVYAYTPENRHATIEALNPPWQLDEVVWQSAGGNLALRGIDFRTVEPYNTESYFFELLGTPRGHAMIPAGAQVFMQLYWQLTTPEAMDKPYSVFIHLRDLETGAVVSQRDGEMVDGQLPMTLLPYPDILVDRRIWNLPADLEPGRYELFIGIYDPVTWERLPVYQAGEPAGDGFLIREMIEIMPPDFQFDRTR